MLNAKAFANATTSVLALLYILCLFLSSVGSSMMYALAQNWVHTVRLEPSQMMGSFSLVGQVIGLIVMAIIAWITTYVTIELYNRWAK